MRRELSEYVRKETGYPKELVSPGFVRNRISYITAEGLFRRVPVVYDAGSEN